MLLPASFAKGILKLIIPEIIEMLIPIKSDLKKHSQYVNEPNDADRRIDKLEAQIKMLAQDQHPPVIPTKEWEQMKTDMGKIKNTKIFKRGK